MKEVFPIEDILLENNVLFVASSSLSKYLTTKSTKFQKEMLSIEVPTLWELQTDALANEALFLHIDFFEPELMITLSFTATQQQLIRKNCNIEILGIIIESPEANHSAPAVIFIPEIKEGLQSVIDC